MTKKDFEMTWQDVEIGSICVDPGSAKGYKTGDWRAQQPTYDFARCIKCATCYIFCPEGCIGQNAEGHFETDLYWCKGCGICSRECPTGVITLVEEVE